MNDMNVVDDSNFETEVLQSEVPVLVDFSASWCAPCKKQHPILEKYAIEVRGHVKVVQMDIDEGHHTAARYGIKSVPTLVLFDKGLPIGSLVGLTPFVEVLNFVMARVSVFNK